MNREVVIAELRRVAKSLDIDCLSRGTFQQHSTMSSSGVERTFGSWNEAIAAAGLKALPPGGMPRDEIRRMERLDNPPPNLHNGQVSDDELLEDLIRLARELGRRPSGNQIAAKGKFDPTVYKKRWVTVAAAYAEAKKKFGND
jgi:hypothetical protein